MNPTHSEIVFANLDWLSALILLGCYTLGIAWVLTSGEMAPNFFIGTVFVFTMLYRAYRYPRIRPLNPLSGLEPNLGAK